VRKRSPMSWRTRQIVIGSRSRPDAWLPILFRGLNQLGLPVVCVESRQAYQALKSLATPRPITMTREAGASGPHGSAPRHHHARDVTERNRVRAGLGHQLRRTGDRIELPQGATPEGGSRQRRRFCCTRPTTSRLRFQPSRPALNSPHQAPAERAENAGIPRRRYRRRASPLTH
jgi:hypothetical protein